MGLFLSMSGVVGASQADVAAALRDYAAAHGGRFEQTTNRSASWEVLIIGEADGHVTVVYPGNFFKWDEAAAHLSRSLDVPVFSFHIHDEDLWMYLLFVAGEVVDQFNPIPDYWDDSLSDEERTQWAGNPAAIARWCPQVPETAIRQYLVPWDLEDETPGKAYEDDESAYGDCWQLVDFMRKLRFSYPFTADGQPVGDTYVFEVERRK
ncbi:MAG: hypothetical protein ACK5EA_20225 [Planctomycetaceae bacterium]|jgi:hypothetical protein